MLKSLKPESRVLVGTVKSSRNLRVFFGFIERTTTSFDSTISLVASKEDLVEALTSKILNSKHYGELRLIVLTGLKVEEVEQVYKETSTPTMLLDSKSYVLVGAYGILNSKHVYNAYIKSRGLRSLRASSKAAEELLNITLQSLNREV